MRGFQGVLTSCESLYLCIISRRLTIQGIRKNRERLKDVIRFQNKKTFYMKYLSFTTTNQNLVRKWSNETVGGL